MYGYLKGSGVKIGLAKRSFDTGGINCACLGNLCCDRTDNIYGQVEMCHCACRRLEERSIKDILISDPSTAEHEFWEFRQA